ncbi:F0F1 ATP synthase subunit B [Desulfobacterota bacterium M19]
MKAENSKIKLTLTIALGVLAVATAAWAGETGEVRPLISHGQLVDFGLRCMNFAVLVVILLKYVVPPIGKALSDRRTKITEQFGELREKRSEVETTYKEYETKLSHIDEEVESILNIAITQAENEKARIISDAERTAEDIKRKAAVSVQNELSKARKELRDEVAEQAAIMAEEIIKKNFTETDQTKLVEDYLGQVGAMA